MISSKGLKLLLIRGLGYSGKTMLVLVLGRICRSPV